MAIKVHMPQAILGRGKTLGEKQVGFAIQLGYGEFPKGRGGW